MKKPDGIFLDEQGNEVEQLYTEVPATKLDDGRLFPNPQFDSLREKIKEYNFQTDAEKDLYSKGWLDCCFSFLDPIQSS